MTEQAIIDILVANPNKALCELISDGILTTAKLDSTPNSLSMSLLLHKMGKESKINVLRAAIKEGNNDIFFEYIRKTTDKKYEIVMAYLVNDCARYGRMEMLKYFTDKVEQEWNELAEYAAEGGHLNIVNMLVTRGFKDQNGNIVGSNNYSMIAYIAAKKNYTEIVERMLLLGADDYSLIAEGAGIGCNKKLLIDMIEKAKNNKSRPYNTTVWENIFNTVAEGGDMRIFNYMLDWSKYSGCDDSDLDWHELANSAAKGGHKELIDIAIDHQPSTAKINWNDIACWAASGGHRELVKDLIKDGASDYVEIVHFATDFNHFDIVLDYIENVPSCYQYIGNEASKRGNLEVIVRIADKSDISDFMSIAAYHGHRNIVEYCVKVKKQRIASEFAELCRTKPLD